MTFIESLKAGCFDYEAISERVVFRFHRISDITIIRDFPFFRSLVLFARKITSRLGYIYIKIYIHIRTHIHTGVY